MTEKETTKILNDLFTHKNLILFAKDKLSIESADKFKTKKELLNYIVETVESKKILSILNESETKKWWNKYHNHVYGLITVISAVLGIVFFSIGDTSTNEISIMGRVIASGTPIPDADISLPQLNVVTAKSGNSGHFTFPPILEKRLPNDSIQIRVTSKNVARDYFFPISEKENIDNLIIDIFSNELIFFDSTKFSILILPFQLLQDCTIKKTSIEETIRTRLNDMAEKDSLNIEVTTLLSGIGCPKSYNEVKEIGETYKANLVIWGDLYEMCLSDSINSCLKYVIVDTPIKKIDSKGKTILKQNTLGNIGEGELQYNIDYIIYHSLALEAIFNKNYSLAIKHCKKIIEDINPNSATTYTSLGYSYYKLKDTLNAQLSFEKAINFEPTKAGAYMNLAMLYEGKKEHDLAKSNFQKAISLAPNNPQMHSNYGSFLRHQKKYKEAEKELNESLKLDPNHINGYVELGNLYSAKNVHVKARSFYKKALNVNPNFEKAHLIRHNFGRAFLKTGELDSAKFYLRKNLELRPDFAGSYFVLGQVYLEKGKIDTAQQFYLKYCELAPEWKLPKLDSLFHLIPNSVN